MSDFYTRTSDMDCPECGQRCHGTHILWRNGYGEKKRRFCKKRDCWWDHQVLWQTPPVEETRIVKHGDTIRAPLAGTLKDDR